MPEMNTYRIDYFSRKRNAYVSKRVKANSYNEAIKKSRVKNIEEIVLESKGGDSIEQDSVGFIWGLDDLGVI